MWFREVIFFSVAGYSNYRTLPVRRKVVARARERIWLAARLFRVQAAMGGHPSNKAHASKKLESGQTWHLGQFRHAGFRSAFFIFIRVAVLALGAHSVGAPLRGLFRGCGTAAAPYTPSKVAKNDRESILV